MLLYQCSVFSAPCQIWGITSYPLCYMSQFLAFRAYKCPRALHIFRGGHREIYEILTGLVTQAGITSAGLSLREVMCKGEIAVFSGTRE